MKGKQLWIRYPKKDAPDYCRPELSITKKYNPDDDWDEDYDGWTAYVAFELEETVNARN